MDENIPKIDISNISVESAFYIAKQCLDCLDSQGNPQKVHVVEDMQLPTLESAIAMIKGFTGIALKRNPTAKYEDGILYMTDDEGDSHRYIQAVITGNPSVVWNSTVAENTSAKFNDIISGIDLDTTTE